MNTDKPDKKTHNESTRHVSSALAENSANRAYPRWLFSPKIRVHQYSSVVAVCIVPVLLCLFDFPIYTR
jgi:hypothetical protein